MRLGRTTHTKGRPASASPHASSTNSCGSMAAMLPKLTYSTERARCASSQRRQPRSACTSPCRLAVAAGTSLLSGATAYTGTDMSSRISPSVPASMKGNVWKMSPEDSRAAATTRPSRSANSSRSHVSCRSRSFTRYGGSSATASSLRSSLTGRYPLSTKVRYAM
uniref:Uncharacterized protein n=1 Tax=Zea mays TaxID=4577 RepID=C4J5X2_MAIZE|nr:unknown [Zea mays]